MWVNIIYVVAGLGLLVVGGNWLLKSSVGLSLKLNISRVVIGLTIVSFATSAPELIVSVKAALNGNPDIAVGNVVGSNIANIAFVLGLTLLFGSITAERTFLKVDWPSMMIFSLALFGLTYFDKDISRMDGIILLIMMVSFIVLLIYKQKKTTESERLEELPESTGQMNIGLILLLLALGGMALWGGSELLISGAVGLAEMFNVSKRVIALTVVSVGTSIPELAASIIAVIKKEKAISLGNLVGSNIFNIGTVLGVTASITPISNIDEGLLGNDMLWMLGTALLLILLAFVPKRLTFDWKKGIVLIGIYGYFVYTAIM
ncbi:MAG: calcium/sodium antiporter [Capnocytophaga sp.]|nr:calcium/sodium antiporter [Capnocytophaga sp.]